MGTCVMNVVLLEDTRNKPSEHVLKNEYWQSIGLKVVRTKLLVGDYMLIGGTRSIDTKKDVLELCGNIIQQHDRFRRELELAKEVGISLTVLVENADGVTDLSTLSAWRNPRAAINARRGLRPPVGGMQLAKACATMEKKYGVRFDFCQPQEAGARVLEILEEGGRDGRNIAP